MDLSAHSDEDLLASVTTLVASHRELTAKLVAHLSEIEERRLHLLGGYSSMFDFCQTKLGMSENEAFRRILAARLARRFPVIYTLLASGSVNLTTLELLRDRLTADNHADLFAAVAGKSKREVLLLLAARFPEPDRPSSIRPETRDGRTNIEPLSEARYRIEFTASEALREKLELCRDLMSHANPTRDLAAVIERGVDLFLAELERKRLAKTTRPRRTGSRRVATVPRITTAARREVFERDGVRCTYVAANGRRCEARAFLELDHVNAKALGGSSETDNLRVLCRAHNQLWAEQTFGRERIERSRHFCQQRSTSDGGEPTHTSNVQSTADRCESMRTSKAMTAEKVDARAARASKPEPDTTTTIFAKVHSALRHLGFREAEARRAISRVASVHDSSESLTLEQALREAIHVATAA